MTTSLITRYQERRARKFRENEERWSTLLPSLRTRSRRRLLVAVLLINYLFMFVVAVLCHFDVPNAPLLWLPAYLVSVPIWVMVQIVSGRQGDAPATALDEWEVEQRNEARSMGFTVMGNLVLLAVAYTVVTSVVAQPDGNPSWHYAAGLFTLVAVLIGMTTPAMILAWTRPDIDAEDAAV
ncbi:hypothetical protein FK529_03165 [Tsukamurella asaccharolytica]|uniref:Uncharacterized protein n=1 Tax=Tsukamurella asaccharolytica TaxID=2592067 RepID=A0A5C5RE83_9ACTN|nr:hypothetical protein [Tsukamurella asaccharolytica]TWS20371.1 hypothetical protein FK529_03165 [Tsukamurella asaccharolytica]